MDKNAIKKFAVWARTELIARVSLKGVEYGITGDNIEAANADSVGGKVLTADEKKQRQALIAEINDKGYKQVMEEVAYTWFNRFSALRFMEVNGYLPSHVRVFTDEENNFKPQIITEAIHLDLDGLDMEKVYELKDAEKTEELYKYLLIVQCNALNKILPGIFQKIADYTELLLPDNLLREGSVIQQMIELIPEDDWKDAVQIIGWLYQYYNSEKKDDVFAALKKNVKITKENIPAATQLFTPDWIVRYMVENSLGRLWLEGHPDVKEQLLPTEEEQSAYATGNRDPEDSKWHYYLEEAEQEPEVQAQLAEIRKEYAALTPDQLKVIDPCSGSGHMKKDCFFAEFSNLGVGNVPIADEYPEKFDRLLCGGIWCIVQLDYEVEGDNNFGIEDIDGNPLRSKQKKQKDISPISIRKLTPIQMPHIDIDELKQGRKAFTKDEWLDILLRSIGMEPDEFTYREKWLLLTRMIPLVENNFNLCELGPRSTGKSHLYKEISPNSILISGGQTTVANLFYNMGRKTVGLVGLWDCVAFDEVAGIKFKDKDGIQIMKDYMASGSFARGKEEKAATASMVFVGNINQSVDVLLKTSSLFAPFPQEMGTDTAFLDRMHCYLPGWEIPKFRPEHFTDDYGFISDYLAEFIRELRKEQYGDALDHYFRLGRNLNQRDTIAVRRMIDGYLKLMYPNGEFTKEELEEIIQIALEMRRRVKEQLKKLGGMEFYDVNFSYIDLEDMSEHYVSVPEQGGGKLIPDGMCNPGQVYTVSRGKSGMIGVFRLESQMLPGNGKIERTGLGSDSKCKEAVNTAFNYLKANGNRISGSISTSTKDYIINYQDLQGIGMTDKLALPTLIALCSIALGKPVVSNLAVLGDITISGTMIKVDELANTLQVCLDSGAKKVLIPSTSFVDFASVPADLMSAFQLIPYQSAEDAVFKALGVE